MTINKIEEGNILTVQIDGRIDTRTAPVLEKDIRAALDSANELIFDFSNVEYISSAGLRVLISAHKIMRNKGGMKITNVNDDVREIFSVTGLAGNLRIE